MNIQTKHIIQIIVILGIATILNVAISYYFLNNKLSIESRYTLNDAYTETVENWHFYKQLPIILELVDPEFTEELEKQFENEEEGAQSISAVLLFELNKNENLRNAMQKRFADYQDGKEKMSKLDLSDLFQKNNACSNLASDIEKGLKEKEEFEFIFYSPVLNECIYSISRTKDANKGYKDYKVLFSGTTRKELDDYLVYISYNYKDILGGKRDSLKEQVKTEKKKYLDFVLTNSLYNFDLLEGVSNIGNSF